MTAVDIVRASYVAYAKVDRAGFEALMAPDFHFTSPLDYRLDRAGYFARCWPERASGAVPDFIRLVGDGDIVFATYEAPKSPGGRARNTEIFTLRDGLIAEVEVYFGWTVPDGAARFG